MRWILARCLAGDCLECCVQGTNPQGHASHPHRGKKNTKEIAILTGSSSEVGAFMDALGTLRERQQQVRAERLHRQSPA